MHQETKHISKADAIFGTNVRSWRDKLGLTQRQLANILEVPNTRISEIERGRHRVLLHTVFSVAEAFGIPPEVLITEPKELNDMRKEIR